MRVALTGNTGLIGSAVVNRLRQDHEVVTLGRSSNSDILIDLAEPASLDDLDIGPVDALVHCAGVVDEDFAQSSTKALRAAFQGTDALVKRAVEHGAQRLVYISSAHVYGPMTGRINESSPVNPVSDYALCHYATEQIFRRHTSERTVAVALRPCAVFGQLPDPGAFRRWSLVPFAFPRDALTRNRIDIASSGRQRRNFVGTTDIAAIVAAWLEREYVGQWTVINPVGVTSESILDFARRCARVLAALDGTDCAITSRGSDGPVQGEDFDYEGTSPVEAEDIDLTLTRLMQSIGSVT